MCLSQVSVTRSLVPHKCNLCETLVSSANYHMFTNQGCGLVLSGLLSCMTVDSHKPLRHLHQHDSPCCSIANLSHKFHRANARPLIRRKTDQE